MMNYELYEMTQIGCEEMVETIPHGEVVSVEWAEDPFFDEMFGE